MSVRVALTACLGDLRAFSIDTSHAVMISVNISAELALPCNLNPCIAERSASRFRVSVLYPV